MIVSPTLIRRFITGFPPLLVAAVQRLVAQLAVALARDLALVHHQIAGDELHFTLRLFWPLASLTTKQASLSSSIVHGGGKTGHYAHVEYAYAEFERYRVLKSVSIIAVALILNCRIAFAQQDQYSANSIMTGCREEAALIPFSNPSNEHGDLAHFCLE